MNRKNVQKTKQNEKTRLCFEYEQEAGPKGLIAIIRIRSGSPQVVCGIAPIKRVTTSMIRIRLGSPLLTIEIMMKKTHYS